MKAILFILLSIFIAQPAYADELAGLWETSSDKYIYFKEDGTFSFINSKIFTGYSWQRTEENTIKLHFFDVSADNVQEKDCLAVISGSTLTFEVDGEVYTVKKSSKKVTTFKGEIFYRERIQLPPKVNVRYALYKNGETVPFALYFIPTAGRTPLPFSFDCVVNSGDKISVSAAIAHENMPLFTTPEPVSLEEKNILLRRAEQATQAKELPVPAAFLSAQGDVIFLEKNNLAIVKKQNALSIAHWAQIDRNHNLELIQRNDVPVTAKIQDENTFIFSQFEDKKGISFSRVEKEFFVIGKFNVTGVLQGTKDGLDFVDCASLCRLPIAHKGVIAKAFPNNSFARPCMVDMELILRRLENGEIDAYPVKAAKAQDKGICESMVKNMGIAGIENTYWRLTMLNEKNVELVEGQSEPHIIIRDNMATGSDGCNNFFLGVQLKDNSIKFGLGGSTLMLCPHGEELAMEFNQTLQKVDAWQISGSLLKLLQNNTVLAVFEAVYL